MSYRKISDDEAPTAESLVYNFRETFRRLAWGHNKEYDKLIDNVALVCKEYNIPSGDILVKLHNEYKESLNH